MMVKTISKSCREGHCELCFGITVMKDADDVYPVNCEHECHPFNAVK